MLNDIRLREVFHFCFLERLLKSSDPALYVLKGGVNLRFFFNSPRYSEDMDLDVLGGSVATLKKNGYKILQDAAFQRQLRSYGIAELQVNDPEKAKQTETTQRFRVGLVNHAGLRLPTKIEFSRRAAHGDPFQTGQVSPDIARNYRRLAFSCQHYHGEVAVLQKFRALAGRPATQARDVFDLGILQAGGFVNIEAVNKLLMNEERKAAVTALRSLSWADFEGQVLEFLDEETRPAYASKTSWQQLQERIHACLES